MFNPRPFAWRRFTALTCRKGLLDSPPLAVWLLMELEIRKKERVALHERKPMVPNFRVLGQPVTS